MEFYNIILGKKDNPHKENNDNEIKKIRKSKKDTKNIVKKRKKKLKILVPDNDKKLEIKKPEENNAEHVENNVEPENNPVGFFRPPSPQINEEHNDPNVFSNEDFYDDKNRTKLTRAQLKQILKNNNIKGIGNKNYKQLTELIMTNNIRKNN